MKNSRWNKEQEAMLVQTVQKASTTSKGIRSAARKLKRTAVGCAQRYYLLQTKGQVDKRMSKVLPINGKVKAITITSKSINLIF
jgi:hypothetical protein